MGTGSCLFSLRDDWQGISTRDHRKKSLWLHLSLRLPTFQWSFPAKLSWEHWRPCLHIIPSWTPSLRLLLPRPIPAPTIMVDSPPRPDTQPHLTPLFPCSESPWKAETCSLMKPVAWTQLVNSLISAWMSPSQRGSEHPLWNSSSPPIAPHSPAQLYCSSHHLSLAVTADLSLISSFIIRHPQVIISSVKTWVFVLSTSVNTTICELTQWTNE